MKKQRIFPFSNFPTTKNKLIIGILFLGLGIVLLFSLFSFSLNWKVDQSQLHGLFDKTILAENALGKVGNFLGYWFIGAGIGVTAFLFPIFLIAIGVRIGFNTKLFSLKKYFNHMLFFLFWLPILFALIAPKNYVLFGVVGYESFQFLFSIIGKLGIIFLLLISFIIYGIVSFKQFADVFSFSFLGFLTDKWHGIQNSLQHSFSSEDDFSSTDITTKPEPDEPDYLDDLLEKIPSDNLEENVPVEEKDHVQANSLEKNQRVNKDDSSVQLNPTAPASKKINETTPESPTMIVEAAKEEITDGTASVSENLVRKHGEYDHTLDLPKYLFPPIDFLNKYSNEQITIDQSELESNKNRIVETLNHYNIEIEKIKATVGPTITLYEIVPKAGIRISRIKNLEDDIALSLSALGIRIIAPIPGKGTIGIEVPNKNARIVSMHSVLSSEKFKNSQDMALPIAFGKTISNETLVVDLAKMPHLLMAGATGQGKSVGLNAILTSLLYRKHPSELKFVLVDPKKVELTLYSKIVRHYLAKLPDSEEAIITDNTKVINTLNSLCIEMDDRYELLKNAMARNITEYNKKFKQRKLNPNEGHRYLPYIVLVIDEFADLIMTAGKEVETPVGRLAQLARAIGIHLIIATQRPSVNVITGIIKANFPARIAFRVTSKIDSRTILDAGGADQLIGKGDMLYSTGNSLIRLQCAFVDTPEVEKICDFIGHQKGYPDAMLLPDYQGDDDNSNLSIDLDERDSLFNDAAHIIVSAQQGSVSLLQRKLKLGYNRAGRLIDQLEAAGIVGPFEGSKARQVLIQDPNSLEQLLNNLD